MLEYLYNEVQTHAKTKTYTVTTGVGHSDKQGVGGYPRGVAYIYTYFHVVHWNIEPLESYHTCINSVQLFSKGVAGGGGGGGSGGSDIPLFLTVARDYVRFNP